MIKFILSLFLFLCGYASFEQSVYEEKNHEVIVAIKLFNTSFLTADSIKFMMTITNASSSTQKILFDKPLKHPWSTSVALNEKQGKPVKITTRAFLSSQLYIERQLREFYRELKVGESVSHIYYLREVVRFDTKDGALKGGTYTLRVNYDTSASNEVTFIIK